MATGFCTLLGAVCRRLGLLALCLPVVLVMSVALSPVFVNFKMLAPLQRLLPTNHYLYAVTDSTRISGMILYVLVSFVAAGLLYWAAHRNGEQ
jgi:hypothetical protein